MEEKAFEALTLEKKASNDESSFLIYDEGKLLFWRRLRHSSKGSFLIFRRYH
jgi:hypothetical protein